MAFKNSVKTNNDMFPANFKSIILLIFFHMKYEQLQSYKRCFTSLQSCHKTFVLLNSTYSRSDCYSIKLCNNFKLNSAI